MKNADSKEKHPVALNIAMITLYKQDKSVQNLQQQWMEWNFPTMEKVKKLKLSRQKTEAVSSKVIHKNKECMLGPPDKEIHFARIKRK